MCLWIPEITVVKRDGSREPFIYEKIVVSCLKSGATLEAARRIATSILAKLIAEERKEVSARELTRWILQELRAENEEWYRNWIIFDRVIKRRKTEEELQQQS